MPQVNIDPDILPTGAPSRHPVVQIILTSNLLSKLAFLKEEVTELASFSAIHALKSLTAKEAAMPVKKKTTKCERDSFCFPRKPLLMMGKATSLTRFPEMSK